MEYCNKIMHHGIFASPKAFDNASILPKWLEYIQYSRLAFC